MAKWPFSPRDSDALWSPGFRILHLQNQRDCERSTDFWFGLIFFFFFPKRKRERYNDVNVTVATSLRVSLREFARVREFERVLRAERAREWEGEGEGEREQREEREKEKEKKSSFKLLAKLKRKVASYGEANKFWLYLH